MERRARQPGLHHERLALHVLAQAIVQRRLLELARAALRDRVHRRVRPPALLRLQRDHDTYVELPGRIGVWNRYTVDLDPARASPRALIPIGVALVGAVRHDYRGAAGGEFGGILEN